MSIKSRKLHSRFFTPPQIKKLNLDLARLRGGGYAPAQFYGETQDGREVYCRYRGGWLSVTIDNVPGVDPSRDGSEVLGVQLGPPPFGGGMTLGQLCRYAGITINGELPPLPTADEIFEDSAEDLSGYRSFFNANLTSTLATQKSFIQRLLVTFDDCRVLQPIFEEGFRIFGWKICHSVDDITDDFFDVVRAEQWGPAMLLHARGARSVDQLFPESMVMRVVASGFRFPMLKYGNEDASRVWQHLGLEIKVAGQCEDMLHGRFSLSASFRTDDAEALCFLQRLDHLIDDVYPAFRVVAVDLVSGEQRSDSVYVDHFDPAIALWMGGHNDRWLAVRQEGTPENVGFVGLTLAPLEASLSKA